MLIWQKYLKVLGQVSSTLHSSTNKYQVLLNFEVSSISKYQVLKILHQVPSTLLDPNPGNITSRVHQAVTPGRSAVKAARCEAARLLRRATTPEQTQLHVQMTISVLQFLGWIINYEKSDLTPNQDFQFIGMQFNTRQFTVAPLPKMRLKVQSVHQHWMTSPNITARDLHRLLGMVVFMASLVPRGRLHLRPVQWWAATAWCQRTGRWTDRIKVPQWVLSEVAWWVSPAVLQGLPLATRETEVTLFTDASSSGWGAQLGSRSTQGQWLASQRSWHINILEMQAVINAVRDFLPHLRSRVVHLMSQWLWLTSGTREAHDHTHSCRWWYACSSGAICPKNIPSCCTSRVNRCWLKRSYWLTGWQTRHYRPSNLHAWKLYGPSLWPRAIPGKLLTWCQGPSVIHHSKYMNLTGRDLCPSVGQKVGMCFVSEAIISAPIWCTCSETDFSHRRLFHIARLWLLCYVIGFTIRQPTRTSRYSLMIRRASAKLENSFVTANFASARAQLSKLERQRVVPPNCGQIMKKKKTVHLSQVPNSPPNLNFARHFLFQ